MLWRQAITIAALLGAAGVAPVAAEASALDRLAPQLVDSEWPAIVPRLASYTVAQKAAITDVVERYCTEHRVADRKELQEQIQKLLTPDQVIEAIRYWLPQDVQQDVRALKGDDSSPSLTLDACDRPVHSVS